MSFILDALKKSEHARQSQAGPSLADVQLHRPQGERPWWAVLIAVLLAVNVLVLILVLARKPAAPEPAPTQAPAAVTATQAPAAAPAPRPVPPPAPRSAPPSGPSVSLRTLAGQPQSGIAPEPPAAAAPQPQPQPQPQPHPVTPAQQVLEQPVAQVFTPGPAAAPAPQPPGEVLPTATELLASGTRLPDLHLDIHVNAEDATQRFVFINMRKYVEGDTLTEGPRLERITADGVVLNQQGLRFLLPRQ